jgi:hypothetical protein
MQTAITALAALIAIGLLAAGHAHAAAPPQAAVEIEEDVYRYDAADNGAGPMWCFGSTCLVRVGDEVFASGLETIRGAKPLNNCRWVLFKRGASGWDLQRADPAGRTREPCPLVAFPDGRVMLSANPALTGPDVYSGPARPEILQFSAADPRAAPTLILPVWQGEPKFTEHSYRSFAADGPAGELILFQNIGYTHAEWAFRDRAGTWSARGQLAWPWGKEYEKPQPIRVCYPTVALKNRAVHFCGVSDIVEPNSAWRAYKKELTGKEWDYDFRRLFYTWTADITTGRFEPWVEVASREKTCGWIMPRDLWVAPDGAVHILWTERAIDPRLREKFFAGEKQSHSLNHAIVRDGKVVARRALMESREGVSGEAADGARFHITPEGRLFVVYYVGGTAAGGRRVSENRLVELQADGAAGPAAAVAMKFPLRTFFSATPRAGSLPSKTMDLMGEREGSRGTISYARLRLP